MTGSRPVILIVDDNDMVRDLLRRILSSAGYEILEARNGRDGLLSCEANLDSIDLLLTDMSMPELDGRKLAEGARKLKPDLKIVYMSGCFDNEMLKATDEDRAPFLEKPFTASHLTATVRQTLGAGSRL